MTRADREHLAQLLEEIAAELAAAPDRIESEAKADCEKRIAEFPGIAGLLTPHPTMVGALQATTAIAAGRIRGAVAAFLKPNRRRAA